MRLRVARKVYFPRGPEMVYRDCTIARALRRLYRAGYRWEKYRLRWLRGRFYSQLIRAAYARRPSGGG
jgi:hypothetical protein